MRIRQRLFHDEHGLGVLSLFDHGLRGAALFPACFESLHGFFARRHRVEIFLIVVEIAKHRLDVQASGASGEQGGKQ